MRIKYVIPFPFDEEGIANRAAQIPADLLGPETEVECVPVRNSATLVDCYYEDLVFDMYIVEAGLRAEDEGYDALIMDTVSDSGLYALRSRLSIPVIGPGLVSYAVGIILGKRFSIVTMWDKWAHLYEKNLAILLGSTTMHQAGDYMSKHLPAPVINPGPVAIKLTESFVQLGLTHSKVAFPSPSTIIDDRFFSLAGAGAAV